MRRLVLVLLPVTLAVIAPSVCMAGPVEDARRLVSLDVPDDERKTLKRALKAAPFGKVAPVLLTTLAAGSEDFSNPCDPILGDYLSYLSPHDKAFCAAHEVWREQLMLPSTPEKADVLLELLSSTGHPRTVSFLLSDICHGIPWRPHAEAIVMAVRDANPSTYEQEEAAKCLLANADPPKHFKAAMKAVKDSSPWRRSSVLRDVFNVGYRLHQLKAEQQGELVDYGFQLLAQEVAENGLEAGYFTAQFLGFLLKMPDGFAPDKKLEESRDNSSLNLRQRFVRDALHWRETQRQ